jgi:hypothetical protein
LRCAMICFGLTGALVLSIRSLHWLAALCFLGTCTSWSYFPQIRLGNRGEVSLRISKLTRILRTNSDSETYVDSTTNYLAANVVGFSN